MRLRRAPAMMDIELISRSILPDYAGKTIRGILILMKSP
jgi:hypothetical protein